MRIVHDPYLTCAYSPTLSRKSLTGSRPVQGQRPKDIPATRRDVLPGSRGYVHGSRWFAHDLSVFFFCLCLASSLRERPCK